MELVKLMMTKVHFPWPHNLYKACKAGHRGITELLIQKGDKNFTLGLRGRTVALQGRSGHKELVELMISKGADNWNDGLAGACRGPPGEVWAQRTC